MRGEVDPLGGPTDPKRIRAPVLDGDMECSQSLFLLRLRVNCWCFAECLGATGQGSKHHQISAGGSASLLSSFSPEYPQEKLSI